MPTNEVSRDAPLIVNAVRNAQGIEALKSEWKSIDRVNSNGNPFTSYEWISNWYETFGERARGPFRQTPHFLTFRNSDQELVAITPLMRESIGYGRAGIHRLVNAGFTPQVNLTEMPGSSVAPGWEEAHAGGLADRIKEERARFYKIYFSGVERGSPISNALAAKAKEQGWMTGINYEVFKLRVNRSFEEVFAAASGNLRGNFRKSEKALEGHSVQHELITSPINMPAAVDRFLELHTARSEIKEVTTAAEAREVKGHSNYLPTPEHRRFFRRVATSLAPEGNIMISQLRVDGEVAASLVLLISNRTAYRHYSGFGRKWWDQRVMLNLTVQTFKALVEMPNIDVINLSAGRDQTKLAWRPEVQPMEYYGIETTNPLVNNLQRIAHAVRDRYQELR